MKYNLTYQTKNLATGKTYVGVHKTNNLADGYIGNGVYRQSDAEREFKRKPNIAFLAAVVKYGYENFTMIPLSFFDSYEEALEEEKAIVTKEWCKRRDNYNIASGGLGRTDVTITDTHKQTLIDIHSKDYVVVNTHTNEVFFVSNLSEWSRQNYPNELFTQRKGKKDNHHLASVLQGTTKLYKNKWWVCRKKDWTGEPVLKRSAREKGEGVKKSYYSVIDINGHAYEGYNRAEFCRTMSIDKSSFNRLIKGKSKVCQGFVLNAQVQTV